MILIILKPIAGLEIAIIFTFRHPSQAIMIIITMFAFPITLSCFQSRSAVPNSLNRQPSLPSIIARPTLTPSIIAIRQFFPSCQATFYFFHHGQTVVFLSIIARPTLTPAIVARLFFPSCCQNRSYFFHHCQPGFFLTSLPCITMCLPSLPDHILFALSLPHLVLFHH